jgi:hypothetical protein
MAAANRAIDNARSDPKKRKLSRQREPKPWNQVGSGPTQRCPDDRRRMLSEITSISKCY